MDLLGNNVLREFDLLGPSGRFDRTAVMHQRSGGHISICGYMSLNLPLLRSWFSCLTFGIKGKMSRIVACGFSNTALTVGPPLPSSPDSHGCLLTIWHLVTVFLQSRSDNLQGLCRYSHHQTLQAGQIWWLREADFVWVYALFYRKFRNKNSFVLSVFLKLCVFDNLFKCGFVYHNLCVMLFHLFCDSTACFYSCWNSTSLTCVSEMLIRTSQRQETTLWKLMRLS